MKDRIREVRKHANLSQTDFGRKLGVSRGVIANLELGNTTANDIFTSLMCETFNVDRHWLETGEGEMYVARGEDEAFMARALAAHNNDPLLKAFLSAYLALNDERRAVLEDFVADFADKFVAAQSQGRELSMEEYMAARASAPAEPKTSG